MTTLALSFPRQTVSDKMFASEIRGSNQYTIMKDNNEPDLLRMLESLGTRAVSNQLKTKRKTNIWMCQILKLC